MGFRIRRWRVGDITFVWGRFDVAGRRYLIEFRKGR